MCVLDVLNVLHTNQRWDCFGLCQKNYFERRD